MHLSLSADQIITAAVPLIGLVAHYLLTHGKLDRIYLSTNGTVSKLIEDVKDLVAQCEKLKAELKTQKGDDSTAR